ncbi:hypothetical protein, partial [Psychromonas sp. Urea-02u-13]|uniref:hypothetical protein n=1 Tax=Psychromonas sp. Urea-02u-13 TaxID=2058326 RepID=UPI000CACC997
MSEHDLTNDKNPIRTNEKAPLTSANNNDQPPELNLELTGVDDAVLQEIADIQAAIEADDIEAVEDIETAAGEAGDGGSSSAVTLSRNGSETLADSDFSTEGLAFDATAPELTDTNTANPDIDEDITATIAVTGGGTVEEAGGVYLTYTVGLSNAVSEPVTATIADTFTGSATSGADYSSTLQYESAPGEWTDISGEVTLPADGSSINVRVAINDDVVTESDETIVLSVTTASVQVTNGVVGDTGSGTITDDQGTNPIDEDITATIAVTGGDTVEEAG